MFSPWMLTVFYVACGLVIAALLWRMRRKAKAPFSQVPVETAEEPAIVAVSREATDSATVVASRVAQAEPVEEASSQQSDSVIAPASASWSKRGENLVNRPLFSLERKDLHETLPRYRAGELPVAGDGDLVLGSITPGLATLLPMTDAGRTEVLEELQQAGFYQPHALENFGAIRYLLIAVAILMAGTMVVLAPPRLEGYAIGSLIVLPLLAWALPRLYLRNKARERRSEIERAMPDLLDLMNMCVSQGLTIHDSLRRVLGDLRGVYPALSQELRIVSEQARVGSLNLALENFSRRVNVPEVHSFTTLLTQTERMGTSISDALASYSDTMRESLKQRADEKGNRATFRLLFPTVLCLMPAVYLFLLGPAVIELSNFYGRGGRDALDTGTNAIREINQRAGNN